MTENGPERIRQVLLHKKAELRDRLERITSNLRRALESDSAERATQLENSEVVDALGNEARDEMAKISAALVRLESGQYGICVDCGEQISGNRIEVHPYAKDCIDCATAAEKIRSLNG